MQVSPLKGKCIKGKMFFFFTYLEAEFSFLWFFSLFFFYFENIQTYKNVERTVQEHHCIVNLNWLIINILPLCYLLLPRLSIYSPKTISE